MTKPKPRPKSAAAAVDAVIEREVARRDVKPIEVVKLAISAYQAYCASGGKGGFDDAVASVESADTTGLRRGTQSSVDRILFNANYWLAAYERRIVAACSDASDAQALLNAIAVWNTHTLKLNKLAPEEVIDTFERFCPPFAVNGRLGSSARAGAGRGPIPDFKRLALEIAKRESPEHASALRGIIWDLEAEALVYDELGKTGALDALFAALPAWCLQDRIGLVRGCWWDDCDVMLAIAEHMHAQFIRDGYGEAPCRYFLDSFRETLDIYQREISAEENPFVGKSIPDLVELVRRVREEYPSYETDGYGSSREVSACPDLPTWLIGKEQLVWNTIVCAIYGPTSVRPLLVQVPNDIVAGGYASSPDVITELAQTSFARYSADRIASIGASEYASFAEQPEDLRRSSIAHIQSIPDKLKTLDYEIAPVGSCYPDQRVTSFSASEVECLAILEHRRWISERTKAGWEYAAVKSVDEKTSPYLVPWEELPERAREWNRSAIRNIPSLLASAGLAIVR